MPAFHFWKFECRVGVLSLRQATNVSQFAVETYLSMCISQNVPSIDKKLEHLIIVSARPRRSRKSSMRNFLQPIPRSYRAYNARNDVDCQCCKTQCVEILRHGRMKERWDGLFLNSI